MSQTSPATNHTSSSPLGPQLVQASCHQNAGEVAIAAVSSMIALINDNIQFSSYMNQNQIQMGQYNTTASNLSSQNTIQEEEKQITELQKAQHKSFLAKIFGGILLGLSCLLTIASGGIATGLLMAAIGGLSMSGVMGSNGAIGKFLDKVATDLCKLIPGVSQTAMQAIVESIFVAVLTCGAGAVAGMESAATDVAENAAEDAAGDAAGTASKDAESLASKAWSSMKETFGTQKAFAMLTVGSQALLSTNTIQDITTAIVNACVKGGNTKESQKIATIISIVTQVLAMVCTFAAGAGGASGAAAESAASQYLKTLLKVLPYTMGATQIASASVGVAQGVNSLKIASSTEAVALWKGLTSATDAFLKMNQTAMNVTSSFQTSLTNTLQQITSALGMIPRGQQAIANALAS